MLIWYAINIVLLWAQYQFYNLLNVGKYEWLRKALRRNTLKRKGKKRKYFR